jgi:hypothetical protein
MTARAPLICGLCARPLDPDDLTAGRLVWGRVTERYYCPAPEFDECRRIGRELLRAGDRDEDEQTQLEVVGG